MNTGEKIKRQRLLKKISPKDIADLLGMDVSNYYRIERDEVKPDIENLLKIAKHMEIDPMELMSDEKFIFNISSNTNVNYQHVGGNFNPVIHSDPKLVQLLEDKINLLLEKNTQLIEKLADKDDLVKKLMEEVEVLKSKIK